MKTMRIILLVIAVAFLNSCMGDKPQKMRAYNFIAGYVEVSSIKANQVDKQCLRLYIDEIDKFCLYNALKNSDELKTFKELSLKHHDTEYNHVIYYLAAPRLYGANTPDFISVNITSSKDFNASHLSNSSLNNIVRLVSGSIYPFILSGYKTFNNIEKSELFKKYSLYCINHIKGVLRDYYYTSTEVESMLYPIDKMVDEMSEQDFILMGFPTEYRSGDEWIEFSNCISFRTLGYLYFTELPDVAGDYDITVELVGDNGKTYTATTTMTFE